MQFYLLMNNYPTHLRNLFTKFRGGMHSLRYKDVRYNCLPFGKRFIICSGDGTTEYYFLLVGLIFSHVRQYKYHLIIYIDNTSVISRYSSMLSAQYFYQCHVKCILTLYIYSYQCVCNFACHKC